MRVYKQTENYAMREIMGSTVLIPSGSQILSENVLVELNETATFIYNKLSDEKTPDELVAALLDEYDISEERCAADVAAALKKLVEINAASEKEV